MLTLRLHLRACTVLWLLCQMLALAALVPTDCCATHHVAAASASPDCHQQGAAVEPGLCPMHASAGGDCPMHSPAAGHGEAEPCAMRALCNSPAMTLAMLIPVPGVLAVAPPSVGHLETSVPLVGVAPATVERALADDTPPPRA